MEKNITLTEEELDQVVFALETRRYNLLKASKAGLDGEVQAKHYGDLACFIDNLLTKLES